MRKRIIAVRVAHVQQDAYPNLQQEDRRPVGGIDRRAEFLATCARIWSRSLGGAKPHEQPGVDVEVAGASTE